MLFRAVVVDVIYDPTNVSLHGDIMSKFEITSDAITRCPPNSCIVRYYGSGVTPSNKCKIAFPLLSSHLSMPVKPGECVWVFSPSKDEPLPNESYWLCRIVGNIETEDINYTHLPRTPQGQEKEPDPNSPETPIQATSTRAQMIDEGKEQQVFDQEPGEPVKTLPGFENISDGKKFLVDKEKDPADKKEMAKTGEADQNPFKIIAEYAAGYRNFLGEPIPTFYKRPGDLVLQGSNNSLICLGQDRGIVATVPTGDTELLMSASAQTAPRDKSGTIDIVAGRARYLPDEMYSLSGAPEAGVERTNFQMAINSRSYRERFKAPRAEFTSVEGAPDFAADAARLYVSMDTDGDHNFGLLNEHNRMPASFVTGSIQPVSASSYIVAKSDEIRLVARKQLENEYYPTAGNPEINGSIKIIKEGTKDDDLAAVILQPDGTVQVSGSRIFLGRHPDDGGKDEGGAGPEDAAQSQPYVRYKQLEDLLNAILDNIDAFCDTLNTHVTPGYGSPSPQILEAATTLKTEVATRKSEIETLKSERIFGE